MVKVSHVLFEKDKSADFFNEFSAAIGPAGPTPNSDFLNKNNERVYHTPLQPTVKESTGYGKGVPRIRQELAVIS